ncbi:MAG: hypothetical protein GXP49_14875, partial [Deltaproteobacteria bacterium]|nr:hypothetical protein [Deltaproteobacteria bacterium]
IKGHASPMGIVSFELAGDMHTVELMLEAWADQGKIYVALSLGLDFLFIAAYVLAIGLACALLADLLKSGMKTLSRLGWLLSWLMPVAGLLDVVENCTLIQVLTGDGSDLLAAIAKWCALVKFSLVAAGLAYSMVGLAAWFFAKEGKSAGAANDPK